MSNFEEFDSNANNVVNDHVVSNKTSPITKKFRVKDEASFRSEDLWFMVSGSTIRMGRLNEFCFRSDSEFEENIFGDGLWFGKMHINNEVLVAEILKVSEEIEDIDYAHSN